MLNRSTEIAGRSVRPLVLRAMVVAFFGPVLFTGRVMPLSDLYFFFYPGYVFLKESVRDVPVEPLAMRFASAEQVAP
jgi:hypothetical protein